MNKTSLSPRRFSDRQIKNHDASSLRLYHVWKGNNIFLLGGRLIFGPDAKSLYLTICLIGVPVILFSSFVSQSLVNHFPNNLGKLFVAIPPTFTVYILILIFLVSGRDPGIIPRNTQPLEVDDEWDASSMSTDWAPSQSGVPFLPPTKSVNVNGMIIRVKFCQTCMLYRPPRCSHCSICNNCVDRFDHHCPWVGQCIGKRNYRYFFMFVSTTACLCLYVFAMCWVNIIMTMEAKRCSLWEAFMESPVSGVLITYTFTVSWFVGGLSAFHLYLVITNQTTYENFRYRYERRMNPYNHGCAHNLKDVLLSRIPSSRNNFRAIIKPESYSRYNSSGYFQRVISSSSSTKKSFDVEMEEEGDVNGNELGLERCGTHPMDHKSKWVAAPELHRLASQFVIENVTTDK